MASSHNNNNKTRLRFTISDDLILLKEVLGQNPYESGERWKCIHETVCNATNKMFSLRAVKEHVEHVIKLWNKQDLTNLRKSGTEEQYYEKEQLLQQIADLVREFSQRSNRTEQSQASQRQQEEKARQRGNERRRIATQWLETEMSEEDINEEPVLEDVSSLSQSILVPATDDEPAVTRLQIPQERNRTGTVSQNVLGPVRYRRSRTTVKNPALVFLQETKVAERTLKEKELTLEERKLELENRKLNLAEDQFQLEKKEREFRLMVEIGERRHRVLLEKQQQELLHKVVTKLDS